MKNGWTRKPLGDLCEVFADGDWIETKDQSPNGIRLVQTGNVGEGVFKDRSEKARYVTAATFKRLNCTEIFEGDCLISRLPDPVGRSCILPDTGERMITAVDCTIVRFDREQLLPEFFNFYSQSVDYIAAVDHETTGTTRKRISRSRLAQTRVPVPAFPEQRRIVAILDEAFAGIATAKAHAEQNLQNAHALFESHLNAVFTERGEGWVEKTLGEASENLDSKRIPITKNKRTAGEYPYYGASGIVDYVNDYIFDEDLLLVSEDGANLLARTYPIAFSVSGKVWVNNHAHVLRFPDMESQRFIEFYLNSIKLDPYVSGMAQPKLNQKSLNSIPVPSPPKPQRKSIVALLDSLREETQRLESIYQRKLASLDELKKSLLHQAFSGELTAGTSVSIPEVPTFPAAIAGISTTDLHAGILALACQLHGQRGRSKAFTHVKAEKIAHMIEAWLGIDLGRQPVKDAAGPNDFNHLNKVEYRARKAQWFDFKREEGKPYRVQKLRGFQGLIDKTRNALGERLHEVEELLAWMLPMKVQQAEIVATVYAAWNNLLLDGRQPTDEEIVQESRENWHEKKLGIARDKFFKAIEWLRTEGVDPQGIGKRVDEKVIAPHRKKGKRA